LRVVLEYLLEGPSGFASAGQLVSIGGEHRLLFGRITNFLSDGDGHRLCWDWRGASSLKPCWKHFNVWKLGSGLAARQPGYVEIDCSDTAQFRSWTASQVYSAADIVVAAESRVLAREMTKKMQQELEQSTGINCNRYGLLMSPTLRSSETAAIVASEMPSVIWPGWCEKLQIATASLRARATLSLLARLILDRCFPLFTASFIGAVRSSLESVFTRGISLAPMCSL
jgi:hypothetical protein